MKHLNLSCTLVDRETVEALYRMPRLRTLNIQETQVTQDDLELIVTNTKRNVAINTEWSDEMRFEFERA